MKKLIVLGVLAVLAASAAALGLSVSGLSALTVAPSIAQAQETQAATPVRESTPYTLATDQPLTVEQQAMRFDTADLSIKVIPQDKAIDAVAVLGFTAKAPLERLMVDLDTLLPISSVQIDGVELAADRWSNPEGQIGRAHV